MPEIFQIANARWAVETWKADHDLAMQCYDLEEWIARGLTVFGICEGANEEVRHRIYMGRLPADCDILGMCRIFYEVWVATAASEELIVSRFEKEYPNLARVKEFRTATQKAIRLLENWPPAVINRSPALQYQELTQEEADELTAIRKGSIGDPGILHRIPKAIPLANADIIKNLK